MHELSLCQALVTLVRERVGPRPITQLRRITVAIGSLAGVDADAFAFASLNWCRLRPWRCAIIAVGAAPLSMHPPAAFAAAIGRWCWNPEAMISTSATCNLSTQAATLILYNRAF